MYFLEGKYFSFVFCFVFVTAESNDLVNIATSHLLTPFPFLLPLSRLKPQTDKRTQPGNQIGSFQSLDRFGRLGEMRDNSADVFQVISAGGHLE